MSFSSEVKKELIQRGKGARHCELAELSSIISMLGKVVNGQIIIETDNIYAKERFDKLKKYLKIDIDLDEDKKALKLIQNGNRIFIERILVERRCCKEAYVRGAFIANGSVTNPEKGYHFEIVCEDEDQAALLLDLINDFGLDAKMILRKKYFVIYLKDASMIVEILNIMGAHISLMNMENVRIIKDVSNGLNRKVNCEVANLNKTVSAAVKQIEDIEFIEETIGLKSLPHNLREVAKIRVKDTDLSLKDIGEMINPPLGKSGVNHRLRKISEVANDLRRNKNV